MHAQMFFEGSDLILCIFVSSYLKAEYICTKYRIIGSI